MFDLMVFKVLLNDITLLLALCLCYRVVFGIFKDKNKLFAQIVSGFLFGLAAVIAIVNGFHLLPGVIFDGRTIVISVCGLFCGPVAVLITSGIAAIYRIVVGGPGTAAGVYFIISSALIGLVYYYLHRFKKLSVKFSNLYIFGVVIHVNMLLWFLILPWPIALEAYKVITIPVLVLFPFGTYLFAKILFDQEASILAKHEIDELSKFPSENPNPVLRFSEDGKVLYTNEAGKSLLFKWKLGIGKTVSSEWRELLSQAFASEQVIERELESKGKVFSITVAPIKEAGYANLYAKDITERKQIQHELQESEEHFRLLAEFAPLGIYQGDANGDCVYMNNWWQKITGLSYEKVIGKGWIEAIHPDDRDRITEKWYRSVKANSDYSAEYRFVTPEGEVTWISEKSIILRDDSGRVNGYLTAALDITELKRAGAEIKESEEKYRGLVESSSDWIWEVNAEGVYTYASPQVEAILGLKPEEVVGKAPLDLMLPEEAERISEVLKDLKATGKPIVTLENVGLHKDGRHVILETSGVPVFDEVGNVIGYRGVDRDITERKQAEEMAKGLSNILETSLNEIYIFDATTLKFIQANEGARKNIGYSTEQLQAMTPLDVKPEFSEESFSELIEPLRNGQEQKISFQTLHQRKDGSLYPIEVHLQLSTLGANPVFVAIILDITERKLAEAKLRESEEKYKTIVQSSKDAIGIISQEGIIVDSNPASVELFGYKNAEELISLKSADLAPQYQPDGTLSSVKAQQMIDIAMDKGSHFFEWKLKRRNGEELYSTVHLVKVIINDQELIMATIRDINKRKLAEQALINSEAALRKGQELGHFGNWDWDIETDKVKWSEEIYKMFGKDVERFQPDINKLEAVSASEGKRLLDVLKKRAMQENQGSYEQSFYRADGSLLVVESIYQSQYDEQGNLTHIIGVAHDITERKQAEQERERLEVQLRQAQKLEAIGTLAGGIAHDFNNILTLIIGYTDLVVQQTKEESAERKNLEQVLIASDRAKNLINQILAFSRKTELKQVPTEISLITEEVLDMLRSSTSSTIAIKQNLDAEKFVVKANPTQIHQVLVNLCTNAIHAIGEDNGTLEVSLSQVQLDTPLVTKFGSLLPGPYVKLTVSDNGEGMDQDVVGRIFEPFFTTKAVDKGTGMGLSVVHGIIKSHKGLITVESEIGRGTKFEVYLPRIEGEALNNKDVVDLIQGNGEKILLVDDQLLIVTVMKKTLERLNYEVVGYTDCQKALDDFRDDHEKFDLVITDYSMPDMTGLDLAEKLSAIKSDIPIILYTGYSGSIDPEKARQSGVTEIVSKPIDKKKIAVIIHNILRKGE